MSGVARDVAICAAIRALDADGLLSARQIEDVKDRARFGIERDNLQTRTGDVADVEVFVEEERARIRWRDVAELQAGGGEDERLGRRRDAQRLEQAREERLP